MPELAAALPPEDQLCEVCRRLAPPFRRAVAYGAYSGTLRTLIHHLKYHGMRPIADKLAPHLAEAILLLRGAAPESLTVIAVPMHASKRRQRSFNHAELLALAAVREVRRHCPSWKLAVQTGVLERQRATASQAGLSPRQRRLNLRGAFFVPRPERVRGASILLIDDIYTSGATAQACTKSLREAGAAEVWVATLARAQWERIQLWTAPAAETAVEVPMQEDVAFWGRQDGPLQH